MPNGYDHNWYRLLLLINSFYETFGRWPDQVGIAPISYESLKSLFSPSAWDALQSRIRIKPLDNPAFLAEGAGASVTYGGDGPRPSPIEKRHPLRETADQWLGVVPDIPEFPRTSLYMGIDVQLSVGCPYALIDDDRHPVASGWVTPWYGEERVPGELADVARSLQAQHPHARICIGIDAPRRPLPARRTWRYKRKWVPLPETAKGHGRHCEMVVSALNLAKPQWTPDALHAPPWMQLGFEIFKALEAAGFETFEVFPSASYGQLDGEDFRFELSAAALMPRPKDMMDAVVAALTVAEYQQGRGSAVGGGDGLGTIILPRPVDLSRHKTIDRWPDPSPEDDVAR